MIDLNRGNTFVSVLLVSLLFAAISISSCKSQKASPYIVPACNLPDTVSFKNDVEPIFEMSCNQPSCHAGGSVSESNFGSHGKVNLEPAYAYSSLFSHHLIDTLNPTQSQLYQRLVSTSSPMPPGIYLDNCNIKTILVWIEQGAKNN